MKMKIILLIAIITSALFINISYTNDAQAEIINGSDFIILRDDVISIKISKGTEIRNGIGDVTSVMGFGNIISIKDRFTNREFIKQNASNQFLYDVGYKDELYIGNGKNMLYLNNKELRLDLGDSRGIDFAEEKVMLKVSHKILKIDVECMVTLDTAEHSINFDIKINNKGDKIMQYVEYPGLFLRPKLGVNSADDYFVYPYRGGNLFNNINIMDNQNYLTSHPGAMVMQFMAFYDREQNQSKSYYPGLYIQSTDVKGYYKTFGLIRDRSTAVLRLVYRKYTPERASNNFESDDNLTSSLDYKIKIMIFKGRRPDCPADWYDAADIYKQWARQQEWMKETIYEREDIPKSLFDVDIVNKHSSNKLVPDKYFALNEKLKGLYADMVDSDDVKLNLKRIIFCPSYVGWARPYTSASGVDYFYPYRDDDMPDNGTLHHYDILDPPPMERDGEDFPNTPDILYNQVVGMKEEHDIETDVDLWFGGSKWDIWQRYRDHELREDEIANLDISERNENGRYEGLCEDTFIDASTDVEYAPEGVPAAERTRLLSNKYVINDTAHFDAKNALDSVAVNEYGKKRFSRYSRTALPKEFAVSLAWMCIGTDDADIINHMFLDNIKRGIRRRVNFMKYDGLVGGWLTPCWDQEHTRHPTGYGKWMHDRFVKLLEDTKKVVIAEHKLGQFGIGIESVCEYYLPYLQFLTINQPRTTETRVWDQTTNTYVSKIPLISYVYGGYFIATDQEANIANKNNSHKPVSLWSIAMSIISGNIPSVYFWYDNSGNYNLDDFGMADDDISPNLVALKFLKKLINCVDRSYRSAEMLHPPKITGLPQQDVTVDLMTNNVVRDGVSETIQTGVFFYNPVLVSVLKKGDGTISYIFVNVGDQNIRPGQAQPTFHLEFDLSKYDSSGTSFNVYQSINGRKNQLYTNITLPQTVVFDINFKDIVIFDVVDVDAPPCVLQIPNSLNKRRDTVITRQEIERATDPNGNNLTYTYSGWVTSLPYTIGLPKPGVPPIIYVDVSNGKITVRKEITVNIVESDVNRDGKINALDVQLVINAALEQKTYNPEADINYDGSIDAKDVQLVINRAGGKTGKK